jgi:hypothetical protein
VSGSSTDVNKRICDPFPDCPVGVVLFSSPYIGASLYIGGSPGVCGLSILTVLVVECAKPPSNSGGDVYFVSINCECAEKEIL